MEETETLLKELEPESEMLKNNNNRKAYWIVLLLFLIISILILVFIGTSIHASLCSNSGNIILITGINGLIGSHIAHRLVNNKCNIIYGLVRFNSRLDNLKDILNQIHLIKGDITDSYRIHQIISEIKPTIIYHFAAQGINGISYDNPLLTINVNIDGTLHLLEAIKNNKLFNTKFIFAGSSTEYGKSSSAAGTAAGGLHEDIPLQPITPYGVSKVGGELLSLQYFYTYHIPVIILRFFIQIGKGGTDSLAIQQFCKQIAQIEKGIIPPILYHGNLNTIRDISDIEDMSDIIIQLSQIHGIPGEIYNIGTGQGISIKELLIEAIHQSHNNNNNIELRSDSTLIRLLDEDILIANIHKLTNTTKLQIPTFNITKTISSILNDWRLRV